MATANTHLLSPSPLNDRQHRFVLEYLKDLNATAAYKRAGYEGEGHVATSAAARLLTHVDVLHAIAHEQEQRAQRVRVTADAVLQELVLLCASDITHYAIDEETGTVTLAPEAPPEAMRAVSAIKKRVVHSETGKTVETTLTLWNKVPALKMAGEHLGLFTKRADQGQEISDLLKAVLLELQRQQEPAPALPGAFQPVPPSPAHPQLPPPPAPEETGERQPWQEEPTPWAPHQQEPTAW